MITINMLSSAEKIKGQGVSSAYIEQVNLVKQELGDIFEVYINSKELCDIMHYHTIDLNHYMSLPLSKNHSVTVGYVHFLPETMEESLDLPEIAKKNFYIYMISFYKHMDYLVTVNPSFIKKLEDYNIDRNKITYIPNYASDERFYPCSNDEKIMLRKKYEIPLDKFVVLGAGQVQSRKGINDFIEVAESLPQIQFLWAGGFSFGNITDGYKDLKRVMENPPDNVRFLGIVERNIMNEIYNISDVMFLPSYAELFPMVVLEAMNCKIPILLRELDIYPDILFNFYLKGNSNKEFEKIISKLNQDKDFYTKTAELSWSGHMFYSKEHVLALWKDFYTKVYYENKMKKLRIRVYKRFGKIRQNVKKKIIKVRKNIKNKNK